MREPYGEGVATHTGPESCGGTRKDTVEALTGEHASRALSREIKLVPGAVDVSKDGGNTGGDAIARPLWARRGLRPRACMEAPCAGTGRARGRPRRLAAWDAPGSLRA